MNRRKFIIGIPLFFGGVAVAYPLYKWIRWNTAADFDYLKDSLPLIAALSDTIIPKTDSPAASECGVPEFIVKMVRDCSDTPTQNKFIDGLRQLEQRVEADYGKPFVACTALEKRDIVTRVAKEDKPWSGIAGKVQKRYLGNPFFTTLKNYCTRGYFSSEGGATLALRYSHIPSHYFPCEPYLPGEKAWATS